MHLKILKISQGEKEVWLNIMDDKRIRVLGVVVSRSAAGKGAARLEITSLQHR